MKTIKLPKFVRHEIARKAVDELVAALESTTRELESEIAENERLREVIRQMIEFTGIRMEHKNWMHSNEFSTYTADAWPVLADYMRERLPDDEVKS